MLQAAEDMLQRLLTVGAISLQDISADTDMQQLTESEWFHNLVSQKDEAFNMAS